MPPRAKRKKQEDIQQPVERPVEVISITPEAVPTVNTEVPLTYESVFEELFASENKLHVTDGTEQLRNASSKLYTLIKKEPTLEDQVDYPYSGLIQRANEIYSMIEHPVTPFANLLRIYMLMSLIEDKDINDADKAEIQKNAGIFFLPGGDRWYNLYPFLVEDCVADVNVEAINQIYEQLGEYLKSGETTMASIIAETIRNDISNMSYDLRREEIISHLNIEEDIKKVVFNGEVNMPIIPEKFMAMVIAYWNEYANCDLSRALYKASEVAFRCLSSNDDAERLIGEGTARFLFHQTHSEKFVEVANAMADELRHLYMISRDNSTASPVEVQRIKEPVAA